VQAVHVGVLVAYLAVMVGVGVWFSRAKHVSTGDDFIFAGRRLPQPVLVGTLLATWVGSGTIIGGANFAYTYGPLAGMVFFAGTPVGIIVLYVIAARIRTASRYTVPELLEARFGTSARMVAAAITLLAYVGIVAYQFIGGGYIISLITPLTAVQATVLVAVVVTFLAVGGGLFSVAYTDFLSALVIVAGLAVAVPLIIWGDLGGIASYWDQLPEQSRTLSGGLTAIQLLGFFLPLFLLILADQNMYQRLTAARDEGTARSSTALFFLTSFLITVPVALLASAAAILLPDIDADTAVLSLASEGFLPMVIGGLVLAGALAFIVTTASSFMLSSAGNVVYDIYVRFARGDVPQRRRLVLHRSAVVAVALIAYFLGQFFPTVLALQIYSYTIYGVAMTPAVFAVLFWPRATKAGALASMLVGAAVTIAWETAGLPRGINSVIVSLPAAVAALVLVSLATGPSAQERHVVEEETAAGAPERGARGGGTRTARRWPAGGAAGLPARDRARARPGGAARGRRPSTAYREPGEHPSGGLVQENRGRLGQGGQPAGEVHGPAEHVPHARRAVAPPPRPRPAPPRCPPSSRASSQPSMITESVSTLWGKSFRDTERRAAEAPSGVIARARRHRRPPRGARLARPAHRPRRRRGGRRRRRRRPCRPALPRPATGPGRGGRGWRTRRRTPPGCRRP
jgi:SSS family solute:Na+ symporter